MSNKYYKVITNRKGKKLFQTKKQVLARALQFTTEQEFFIFDCEDGKKLYSFEYTERIEEIAKMLIELHEESLKLKNEQKFDE